MMWSRRAARPPGDSRGTPAAAIGPPPEWMAHDQVSFDFETLHETTSMAAPDDPSNPKVARDRDAADASPSASGSSTAHGATGASGDDARFARAWRVWLEALAHDPEAAWAAALTYKSLGVEGREAWIEALAVDAPEIGAPAIALYAPLLGVEDDPGRRLRIQAALMKHGAPAPNNVLRGLRGEAGSRRVLVIVHPLYLDFVEVLTCTLDGEIGFQDVRHDPIRLDTQAPAEGEVVEGAELETVPMELVIEELAHAVIAHKRAGAALPAPLVRFADLFTPRPESVDREKLRGG